MAPALTFGLRDVYVFFLTLLSDSSADGKPEDAVLLGIRVIGRCILMLLASVGLATVIAATPANKLRAIVLAVILYSMIALIVLIATAVIGVCYYSLQWYLSLRNAKAERRHEMAYLATLNTVLPHTPERAAATPQQALADLEEFARNERANAIAHVRWVADVLNQFHREIFK